MSSKRMTPDEVETYRDDLRELKNNHKPLINMLSQVAEDFKDTAGAEQVSELISERLAEVKTDQKLFLLYLTDSIVKNVKGNYIPIFEKSIVANFEDAFKSNENPDIRKKMFFLRRSWQPIFRDGVLKRLDRRIRMVDIGWPITGPSSQEAVPEVISKPSTSGPPPKSALKVKTAPPPVRKAPEPVKKSPEPTARVVKTAPKSSSGTVLINPAFLDKKANLKTEKLELQVKLDINGDELQEAREKKKKLERQLAKKETAAEKKAIRFKLLEITKKMINLDDQKIELELKMKNLDNMTKSSYQKPDSTKQASQNSQKASQNASAVASPPPKPVKKIIKKVIKAQAPENPLIDILGAPKPRMPSESQKKNLSVASELKNSLKKKSTPPQGPPKKLKKSESEGSLKNNGAPLIPKARIPMKKKSEPAVSKDDAPDIMDTSVVDPPPQAPRPAKISSSSKGSVNVRRPRINPTEILEDFTVPQVREMAENKLRTGLMNRRDYDVLMNRLSVLEKIEKDKKAARSGDSQDQAPPQRRDEDNRTRQPWYSHGTPQDREIYHEHPQRQQDWRDTLWDQYHTVHGDPVPRGSARGPPPPAHDPWKYDPRNERPPGPPAGPDRREMMDPRRGGPHPQDLDHRRSVSPNISANVPSERNYVVTDDLPMPPRPPMEDRPAPVNPAPAAGGLDLPIDLESVKRLLASVESNNAAASQEAKKELVDAPPKKYIILPDAKKAERRTPTPPLDEDAAPIANLDEVKDDFDDSKLPIIEFTENAIKNRVDPFIKRLYAGIQCSACGMRFKKSDSSRYADHLDWHFRVNKQLKNGQLDTHRKWYYKAWDWIMYEEIEDVEKRAEPMDEQKDADDQSEKKEEGGEEVKVKTLPVTAGESCCAVCGERFQTAYDDDEDEWHYQDVVIHQGSGKIVHTGCLEDAGNLHVPRMVRSDSIDSIEMEKTLMDEEKDEDTAQDIGIEMNKMNVSPPREKPEAAEDVEMKEEPQGDPPQSPKVEPTDIVTPTEQPPVKAEIAEPDPLDETNLYGDLAEAELEDINMSFEAPISPHAV